MASSEDKKDEGEVEASSAIREARNFDPLMFRERGAIATRRSFSCAKSWASEREKFWGGEPRLSWRKQVEKARVCSCCEHEGAVHKGGKAALSSLSEGSAWGKEP